MFVLTKNINIGGILRNGEPGQELSDRVLEALEKSKQLDDLKKAKIVVEKSEFEKMQKEAEKPESKKPSKKSSK